MAKKKQEVEETAIQPSEKPSTPALVRNSKDAKLKQRKAFHAMLAGDEEYTNMHEHIFVDEEIEYNLDKDVRAETDIVCISNVMKLIHCDLQGYSLPAIAKAMEIDAQDVQKIRRTDSYKTAKEAVLSEIIATSRRSMEVATLKAVKTLTDCMESKNDKVKLSAAVEVLNRTGLTATQKLEITTQNNAMVNYTEEELAEIVRGSQVIQGEAEVIVDVAES